MIPTLEPKAALLIRLGLILLALAGAAYAASLMEPNESAEIIARFLLGQDQP